VDRKSWLAGPAGFPAEASQDTGGAEKLRHMPQSMHHSADVSGRRACGEPVPGAARPAAKAQAPIAFASGWADGAAFANGATFDEDINSMQRHGGRDAGPRGVMEALRTRQPAKCSPTKQAEPAGLPWPQPSL